MDDYRTGEIITAQFLAHCLNAEPVLKQTRFCLLIAKRLGREAGFEVTVQFRGSIIGLSSIMIGKPNKIVMFDVVLRDLDQFWHVRDQRPADPPKTSQMALINIHAVPVRKDDHLIFVPSRGDLVDVLRFTRRETYRDHRVMTRSLCIEMRPYPTATRYFVVQEQRPRGVRSVCKAVAEAVRAANKSRQFRPIIACMGRSGYNLNYGFFGRAGFLNLSRKRLTASDLEQFEFSVKRYKGK